MKIAEFKDLIGKTLTKIEYTEDEMFFYTNDGEIYRMYHNQDCCECVIIDDICGDLDDLIGSPIIKADEDTNTDTPREDAEYPDESFTWTFYNIATQKGHVTIKWYGSSNGYYSESVDFCKIGNEEEE